MREVLPRSNGLSGLIVGLEGLAFWVLAIFLASYTSTGWLTWPGADMYRTAVGTMRVWLTTPGIGAFELIGYLGLAFAVIGPTWFWIVGPLVERALNWWRSERGRRTGMGHATFTGGPNQVNWVSDTGIGTKQASKPAESESHWFDELFEGHDPQPGPIEQAFAEGDFLRGAGGEDVTATTNPDEDDSDWQFGDDRQEPPLSDAG